MFKCILQVVLFAEDFLTYYFNKGSSKKCSESKWYSMLSVLCVKQCKEWFVWEQCCWLQCLLEMPVFSIRDYGLSSLLSLDWDSYCCSLLLFITLRRHFEWISRMKISTWIVGWFVMNDDALIGDKQHKLLPDEQPHWGC